MADAVWEAFVDVRNAQAVEPEVEHNGIVPMWRLIHPRRFLISIPPDEVHSRCPTDDEPIRCFCFAVGVKGSGPIDYTTH